MRTRKCCRCVTTRLTLTWKYFVKNKRGKKKKEYYYYSTDYSYSMHVSGSTIDRLSVSIFSGTVLYAHCCWTWRHIDSGEEYTQNCIFFFLLFFISLIIFRNKKRFHHQALVEIRILDHLRRRDKDGLHNVIHMLDYFYFRSHLCISFELLR